MPNNFYCPFCGVVLLRDPYSEDDSEPYSEEDPASLQSRRPWCAEVRGIYSTNTAFGHIAITGLGIIRFWNLYAPLGYDSSYVDVGLEALEEWSLRETPESRETPGSRWCFGFHNSCWRLLLLRLGHGQDDNFQNETTIAESVFFQLYCTPYFGAFNFGHDYEGAAQTHKYLGRPKPVDLSSHLYADPCAIPFEDDLKTTVSGFCKAPDGSLWKGRDGARPTTATVVGNFFDGLSPELKFEIFSYLSFDELLNMRLVCRNLALLTTVDTLPQSYWRSRFLLGQEADFLFPRLTNKWDWSWLFFWTRASLRARLLPLVNRKRIRQLLEPIAALVNQKAVFQNGPYGSAFHPVQSQSRYFQPIDDNSTEKPSQLMEVAESFSGQLASIGADSPLGEGCRVLYHRIQPFVPSRQHNRQRIGVSTVQIGARSFISGINLFLSEECNVGRSVGYHIPAFEKWIEIPPSSYVKALCVAFCSEGLTGIKFIFTNSDSSSWVGDSNGPGIAQGTLSIPERLDWYCLLAGLDFFNIVSLGLGKLTGHAEASAKPPSQGAMDSSCVQSHLWIPHPPMHEHVTLSTLLPSEPSRSFEPLINIDFGGSRGLLLGSLTRLAFHVVCSPYPLIGIEIFYSDGKSVLLGSNGGCEMSFFVNGSNGERINKVGILDASQRGDSSIGLGGLQVSTNYGRTVTFAPLRSRLYTSVEPITILPPENTITGFIALEIVWNNPLSIQKPSHNKNRFIRVGIQSQQCDEQPLVPDVVNHECHQIPDEQLRYDEKFTHFIDDNNYNYQTYASLKNVRKIQASMGIRGRSRSPDRISGLKLEYHDHPSPSVVGQWMDGLDDGFELSSDEKVQSLTIWPTPVGQSTSCPGMKVNQITAIHIETTRSRSATFHSPGSQFLPPQKLQHQYQSDTGEELTAISWILNDSADCIRAVISGNGSQRAQIFVPELVAPFDQVQKLYFETGNDDGCRETIIAAEAYFLDQAIIGLVFIYSSERRASIGYLNVTTRQTVHFAQDARIIALSTAGIGYELMEIEFEIEWNERSLQEKLRLSVTSLEDLANNAGYDNWRYVWCRDEASAEGVKPITILDRIYKPPSESRMIGICVNCQFMTRVGALYEPKLSQNA